jgi:hypothetical protein
VDSYIVFDNGSTDESLDLLKKHERVEVRTFPWSNSDSFILSQQNLYNQIWKESRGVADWVMINAIDEHLHVAGTSMLDFLVRCARERVTCVPALGYQMFSEDFPEEHETLCVTRTCGTPWHHMSKLSLFNPNAVEETNYKHGRHTAYPAGQITFPRRDDLLLLHYKYLGFERTYRHHARERSGLQSYDRARRWGLHYDFSRAEMRQYWDEWASKAVNISDPQLRPWATHLGKRWWRSRLFNLKNRIKSKLVVT